MAEHGRNPTIIDVALRAGASKSVVSRVMTGQGSVSVATRERVLAAAEELGYVVNAVARTMVARRTHTIGVFVRDAATPFYGHLLTAMQERAAELGYRVVTATGSGRFALADERRALETLVQLQIEGLVVCSGLLPSSSIAPLASRIPLVVAGRPETHESVSSVFCDEAHGGAALADHVLDLGHRHVAVLTLGPAQSLTMGPRTAAMVSRLRERGAAVIDLPGGRADDTEAVVAGVLAHPEVTAVMTPSDLYALSVIDGLRRHGRAVPEQLSVTGYDGIGVLRTPVLGLTTWAQPIQRIGSGAVDAVVAQLDDEALPAHHQALQGELLVGRTAGPVR